MQPKAAYLATSVRRSKGTGLVRALTRRGCPAYPALGETLGQPTDSFGGSASACKYGSCGLGRRGAGCPAPVSPSPPAAPWTAKSTAGRRYVSRIRSRALTACVPWLPARWLSNTTQVGRSRTTIEIASAIVDTTCTCPASTSRRATCRRTLGRSAMSRIRERPRWPTVKSYFGGGPASVCWAGASRVPINARSIRASGTAVLPATRKSGALWIGLPRTFGCTHCVPDRHAQVTRLIETVLDKVSV